MNQGQTSNLKSFENQVKLMNLAKQLNEHPRNVRQADVPESSSSSDSSASEWTPKNAPKL